MQKPTWLRKAAAILAALLALAGGVTIALTAGPDDPHTGKPASVNVTVTLGGPGKETVTLPPAAQAQATVQAKEDAAGNDQAAHSDLNDTGTADVQTTDPAIAAANNAEQPAGQPAIPANPPLAAQNIPGCRTLLVRNYSSRAGAPVLLFVIHYTVSVDNGWNGVLANVKWFDTPAASASSNYIIDRKIGACALTVAEQSKAWAQAGFNPWALSVEVTANGHEGSLVQGAGKARLLALMKRAHDVYKIPYVHGKVSGCKVIKPGFVIHADLGQCGGGHVDTTPYSIDPLIRELALAGQPTATDRITCRKLNWWRNHGRHHGKPEANAIRRRNALASRGVTCTKTGPVRRT